MSSRSMLALRVSCAAILVYLAMAQAPAFAAGYRCYGLYTTSTVTGMGSDCSAAQADLTAQLNAGAATNCLNAPYSAEGPCNKVTTITAACSCDENGCSVSGYMQHGCWNCGMPGGPTCP
jgi:hypothetical protein